MIKGKRTKASTTIEIFCPFCPLQSMKSGTHIHHDKGSAFFDFLKTKLANHL